MRSYTDTEIHALLDSVRGGDDEAFAELVRRYMPMMTRAAESFRSESSYSEALAEAQIALHRAALAYRNDQEAVTFGLYAKICVCRRLAAYRRREQATVHFLDTVDGESLVTFEGAETALLRDEAFSTLLRRVEELASPYEYRVFLLLIVHGYTVSQTARALGRDRKSVGNARDRLFRRLRLHRELFASEDD